VAIPKQQQRGQTAVFTDERFTFEKMAIETFRQKTEMTAAQGQVRRNLPDSFQMVFLRENGHNLG
jgi:hypothetical protein